MLFREHKIAEQKQDLELIEGFVERKHTEQIARKGAKPETDPTLIHFIEFCRLHKAPVE